MSGDLCLLNPFIRDQIRLPEFKKFPNRDYGPNPQLFYVRKGVLSANPSQTSSFVLVVIHGGILGFWRPGDLIWTGFGPIHCTFLDVIYYQGKLYAIDVVVRVWVWDEFNKPPLAQFFLGFDRKLFRDQTRRELYLVESSMGEFLLLARKLIKPRDPRSGRERKFKVIRLDLDVESFKFEKINDLGGDAIFVGLSVAVSIPASMFPGVLKSNCIYFINDCIESYLRFGSLKGCKDMGIYNLEDSSVERFTDIESSSSGSQLFSDKVQKKLRMRIEIQRKYTVHTGKSTAKQLGINNPSNLEATNTQLSEFNLALSSFIENVNVESNPNSMIDWNE
ncbi:OLC1v1031098C1 [Oldenlandia corymbosa var. corymbosa]|uniref:OLC1v1031098C1 n=1 Tax=Oldenlandia corymbosa var. corymbosa TaxID=529605 RepID=A0AAV1CIN6_OLDCO|nr:OLC1v1031098C1 [Oldenlandia corymbosa var. corymbosa]